MIDTSLAGRASTVPDLDTMLQQMIDLDSSDLHLKPGAPPIIRVYGTLRPLVDKPLTVPEAENLIFSAMTHSQQQEFLDRKELDFAYGLHGRGRFRVSAFFQRGVVSAAFRMVKLQIPSFEELRLPLILRQLCDFQDGIILFTGATASLRGGKGFAAFSAAKFGLRGVVQAMARELGPKNIHVVHLIIDAAVDSEAIYARMKAASGIDARDIPPDSLTKTASIAEAYWFAHQQSKDGWTHELDLRPATEKW